MCAHRSTFLDRYFLTPTSKEVRGIFLYGQTLGPLLRIQVAHLSPILASNVNIARASEATDKQLQPQTTMEAPPLLAGPNESSPPSRLTVSVPPPTSQATMLCPLIIIITQVRAAVTVSSHAICVQRAFALLPIKLSRVFNW